VWEILSQKPDSYELVLTSLTAPDGYLTKKLKLPVGMAQQLVEVKVLDTIKKGLGETCDTNSVKDFLVIFTPIRDPADGRPVFDLDGGPSWVFDPRSPRLCTLQASFQQRCDFAATLYLEQVLRRQVTRDHMGARVIVMVSSSIRDAYAAYVKRLDSEDEVNAMPASVEELRSVCGAMCSIADPVSLKIDFTNVKLLQQDFENESVNLRANAVLTLKSSSFFWTEYLDLTQNRETYKVAYKDARALSQKIEEVNVTVTSVDATNNNIEVLTGFVANVLELKGKIRDAARIAMEKALVNQISAFLDHVKGNAVGVNLDGCQELAKKAQMFPLPQVKHLLKFNEWATSRGIAAKAGLKVDAVRDALALFMQATPTEYTAPMGARLQAAVTECTEFEPSIEQKNDLGGLLGSLSKKLCQNDLPESQEVHSSFLFASRFVFGGSSDVDKSFAVCAAGARVRASLAQVQALGNTTELLEKPENRSKIDDLVRAKSDLASKIEAVGDDAGDVLKHIFEKAVAICTETGKAASAIDAASVGVDTKAGSDMVFDEEGMRWDSKVAVTASFKKLMAEANKKLLTQSPTAYINIAQKIEQGFDRLKETASKFELALPEAVINTKNTTVLALNQAHCEGLLFTLTVTAMKPKEKCGKTKQIKKKLRSLNGPDACEALHKVLKAKIDQWESMEDEDESDKDD